MRDKLKEECDLLINEFNNTFAKTTILLRLYTYPTVLKDHWVLDVFFKAIDEELKEIRLDKHIIANTKEEIIKAYKYIKSNII